MQARITKCSNRYSQTFTLYKDRENSIACQISQSLKDWEFIQERMKTLGVEKNVSWDKTAIVRKVYICILLFFKPCQSILWLAMTRILTDWLLGIYDLGGSYFFLKISHMTLISCLLKMREYLKSHIWCRNLSGNLAKGKRRNPNSEYPNLDCQVALLTLVY